MDIAGKPYPQGIARLLALGKVLVRQKRTMLSGHKYVVTDTEGGLLFSAKEQGGVVLLDAESRSFNINMYDEQNQEVITLRRPYTFGPDKMQVRVCGELASVVRQEPTFMKPVLSVNDAGDRPVLRVKGPAVTTAECEFKIFTLDKSQVGVIRREWAGWSKALTNTDHYQVVFPPDLDVRFKAALISTCLLCDYLYCSQ